MAIPQETLRTIGSEIESAVAAIAAKHELHVTSGLLATGPASASFKVQFAEIGEGGKPVDKQLAHLLERAPKFGITPQLLAKPFLVDGVAHMLVGYRQKASMFPFVIQAVAGGRKRKAGRDVVLQAMGLAPMPMGIRILDDNRREES